MADQPTDLRTLAAERVMDVMGWEDDRNDPGGEGVPPAACWTLANELADAVLAAVLPAHRAEVLAEAAEELRRRAVNIPWSDPGLRRGIQYACAVTHQLAATGPTEPLSATETAQDDSVVPVEAPEAHSGSEGERGQPTPWDIAHREGRAQILEAIFDIDYQTAHRLAGEHWRPAYRQPFPPDPHDCGHDLDAYQRQEGELAQARADVERLKLSWHYGPTDADPDPGKRWHDDCGGEVYYLDGDICSKCGAMPDAGQDPAVGENGSNVGDGDG